MSTFTIKEGEKTTPWIGESGEPNVTEPWEVDLAELLRLSSARKPRRRYVSLPEMWLIRHTTVAFP